jgi:hypothetical protein
VSRGGIALDNLMSRAESDVAVNAEVLEMDEARVTGFIDFDIPFNGSPVATWDDLADMTRWLQQPRRYSGTGVLMDNTTIVTLTSLLAGDRLSPLTLWDLGRAVTAMVTYENVFHFVNREVDDDALNAALGQDVFHPLSLPSPGPLYDPTGVRGLLNQAWQSTDRVMRKLEASVGTPTIEGLEIEALTKQWSLAVGRPLTPADVIDSELSDHEWSSPGYALLYDLWRVSNAGIGPIRPDTQKLDNSLLNINSPDVPIGYIRKFRSTIREGNYRGHINQRLADHLGLSYRPNVARIPFQSRFYDPPAPFLTVCRRSWRWTGTTPNGPPKPSSCPVRRLCSRCSLLWRSVTPPQHKIYGLRWQRCAEMRTDTVNAARIWTERSNKATSTSPPIH